MDLGESDGGLPPDSLAEEIDAILADTERLAALHDGDRVQIVVAPCSPFSVTTRLMEESAALARRLGLQLHTHLAESVEEAEYCQATYGCTPVEYCERVGWLAEDVWCAHCIHLSQAEIERFGAQGVGVAHCPASNLRLGAGIAHVRELLDAGVRVGLGVDGSASNERGDKVVPVWGTGTPTREFLFVEDAAYAIQLAAESLNCAEPVNIGSGQEIAIRKLAELIAQKTGLKADLPGLVGHYTMDRLQTGNKLENLADAKNPGSTSAANALVPGKFVSALRFTG